MSKEEVVQIPGSPYKTPGSFGLVKGVSGAKHIEWQTCRDRFQSSSEPAEVTSFIFCYKPGTADNVIEFMKTVETVLRLPDEAHLTFKKTSDASCLVVEMSDWWKYRVRRSLLTALLRVGQDYTDHTGTGFEKCLNSHVYLSDNRYALDRFLSGAWASKMKKREQFYGWYQSFHGKTPDQVNKVLVKLKKKKPGESEGEAKLSGGLEKTS